MRPGDIAPGPYLGRQCVVAGRTLDQHAVTGVGKAGADISGHRMDHFAVAAFDQNVGHRLAQRAALRDGVKMLLALGAGADQEIPVVEPLGLGQDRAGDFDVVIEGEHVDDVLGRIGDRRQPVRQLGARLGLDGVDQAGHDIVEDADLFLGIDFGAGDEEIGDAGEDIDPARDAAGDEGGLEFVNEDRGRVRIDDSGRRHAIAPAVTMHWNGEKSLAGERPPPSGGG